MTFQQLILALQSYWSQEGCVVGQPYDVEKGAGTFNPHTFLRSLGPEPYNVAYVEPCRRPTDGRYGENPNRLGAYYQFQVLMKPSPKDVLDKYLHSLAALGIKLKEHDVRFVEDDWESPTVGAWGLGWEVWLDGMEITQFTYFQQVGGVECRPVSAEITYGIERIAMYLQGVDSIFDIEWGGGFTYRDVHHQTEVEWSRYNFEEADVDGLLTSFRRYEDEARRLAARGLVFPAYDFACRCSHTFNTLDARGAISVAERAAYIARIRNLSKTCAETYVAERERLGYPILARLRAAALAARDADDVRDADDTLALTSVELLAARVTPTDAVPTAISLAPLLLELGCEEIPARFLPGAEQALRDAVLGFLADRGIGHGEARTFSTPRRVVLAVDSVEPVSRQQEELVFGPPVAAAFEPDGRPKLPASKFAQGQGAGVDALLRLEKPGGKPGVLYLAARKTTGGEATAWALEDELPDLVARLPWPKSMRWGEGDERFARPLHWIVALLGSRQLRFTFAGVTSGNRSWGHRFFGNESFQVLDLPGLRRGLAERHVALDPAARRADIVAQLRAAAAELGGEPLLSPALLDQVVGLVEAPRVVRGAFDPRHLALPEPVIVSILDHHQKMFPVRGGDGALLPVFLGVSNNPTDGLAAVRAGYERVVAARLADGVFFFEQDKKKGLQEHGARLAGITFLRGAGTMADKAGRIAAIARALAAGTGLEVEAERAGRLCKADLTTHLVGEFPELQGTIGRLLARRDGEDAGICEAIVEHYQPRGADDGVPASLLGALVALADKADTLAVCFGLGKAPSGSADPYALRRAALGILRILLAREERRTLAQVVDAALGVLPAETRAARDNGGLRGELLDFLHGRLRALWTGEGSAAGAVDAVLGAGFTDAPLGDARARLLAVEAAAGTPGFDDLLVAWKRIGNLVKKAEEADGPSVVAVDPARLVDPAERALHAAFLRVQAGAAAAVGRGDYGAALAAMGTLRAPLAAFFEAVLVLVDDAALRRNRVGLLAAIQGSFGRVADFARIER